MFKNSAEGNNTEPWDTKLLVMITERTNGSSRPSRKKFDAGAENVQLDKIQMTQIITNITTNH